MMNIPARAYSQYRNKPKFIDWLDIAHKLGGDIEAAAIAVRGSYDIDAATGEQLDVIARIVVIDRGFISDIDLGQVSFAADADETLSQFGDDDAMFSEATAASDSIMSDEIFRIAIKAKIAKNNGDAAYQSILNQVNSIVPNLDYLAITDPQNMTFGIEFAGEVGGITRWALFNTDIIQRPQGVEFLGFTELSDFDMFASDDDETLVQFGDEDVMFSKLEEI